MKTLIPFAAFVALMPLVPATAPARAMAAPPARSQTVMFDDLDLGSASGRARLDRRLHRAAQEVCGEASSLDLAGQNDVLHCRTATIRAATDALARAADRDRTVRVAIVHR